MLKRIGYLAPPGDKFNPNAHSRKEFLQEHWTKSQSLRTSSFKFCRIKRIADLKLTGAVRAQNL